LDKIGLYFHMTETTGSLETELQVSPILTDGRGACQQNFVIIFTDGSWNGGAAGFNNVDGAKGAPYADDYPNTLADIAMYYYMNDLAPAVDDEVPINFVDKANWQHMVTYGVTFGVKGHLTPDDYVLYHTDPTKTVYPAWPDPLGSDADAKMAKIDDVWHAAVNGRGEYFSASNPEELAASLRAALNDIMARIGSGASVSVNGEEIDAGAVVYQSLYATEAWSGDVKAYSVDQATGEIQRDVPLWSAEEELENTDWDTGRIIATYDGTSGMPFRYDDSTAARRDQFALLDGNAATAQNMVNFLRGDASLEVEKGGPFRNRYVRLADNTMRDAKLGDIVHSSPFYQRYVKVDGTTEYGVLFVGGNDGMLHAFDAETGRERFAYVPRLVFENLKYLTQSTYSHKYYVDLTPTLVNTGSEAILIGGLGKGGKGYYALDMSDPDSITSEGQLADKVKWEYPRSSTPQSAIDDIGYSFSRASIAKSNDPAYPWIVVFGNGYQSANGNAVLFILNAIDGTLIRKIDTGVGGCNGLATPTLIDVNRDRKVDYAYAGDLKGNLWKFDLRASNAHGLAGDPGWEVAFYNGATPQPLFQARDGAGTYQPITVRPLVTKHPDSTKHGYLVLFGTGKYLGLSDFSNLQQQTVYGVWDYGDDSDDREYLGYFDRDGLSNQPGTVSLLEQNVIYYGKPPSIGYYLRVLSNNEIVWNVQNDPTTGQLPNPHSTQQNHAGWYFDLPFLKERLVKEMYLRDNKLIFISSIPTTSPCSAGGESILHELNAATGGRLEEAQFDINNDKMINDADLLTITVTIDGVDVEIRVAPTGIHYPSVLYPPTILDAGETREVKLMSTAAGGIVDLWEAAENLGIYYWRQAH
jgi:type IV pilus assembly protein PilY1